MTLAEKGTNKNLDLYTSDFQAKGKDDLYSQLMKVTTDNLIFPWGKAVGHVIGQSHVIY